METPVKFESLDGMTLDARMHKLAHDASLRSPEITERGVALLVHGITADLDEGGMYERLAGRLADAGYAVLRFSFRGHGASAGTQRGVTIAGELLDIEAAATFARSTLGGPLMIVASSFGAVATLETLTYIQPARLVLWNPVLDLHRTFIQPDLPWGRQNFSSEAWDRAMADGALLVDGEFELGRALLLELSRYHPGEALQRSRIPILIVHGDSDSYVSYEIARRAAQDHGCDFHSVAGSDHGFDNREREDEAISATMSWLSKHAQTTASR